MFPEPMSPAARELRALRDDLHARRLLAEQLHALEMRKFDDWEARLDDQIREHDAIEDARAEAEVLNLADRRAR